VTSDNRTWASSSGPATAGSASLALAASAAINTIPDFAFKALAIMAATLTRARLGPGMLGTE
jgi:hypothetical protein